MAGIDSSKWTDAELRKAIGQLFVIGFHGHNAPSNSNILTLINTHHIGGVVFFTRNIANPTQLLELTQSLQSAAHKSSHAHPLFLGIDQENGLVTRIKPPTAAQLPGGMTLGATGSLHNATRVAEATSTILHFYGFNINYAPVADVNNEPDNPVIGVRSPSDDPDIVADFTSAIAAGLRKNKIIPCAKHFPGHGDTAVDSHHGLPVIHKTRADLDACELLPFRRLVGEKIEAIMSAHISLPCLGDELPSSLSPLAMGILRKEFGHEGMIVTDCLEMDGVRATYGTEKSAVMALKAGNDSVMICHTFDVQVASINLVFDAIKSGEIPRARFEDAFTRVTQLKQKFLSWENVLKVEDMQSKLAAFEKIKAEQETMAKDVYQQSTTLVRAAPGLLPLSRVSAPKIVFLSPGEEDAVGGAVTGEGDGASKPAPALPLDADGNPIIEIKTRLPSTPSFFVDSLRKYHDDITPVRFYPSKVFSAAEQKAIDEADLVLLATRNAGLYPYQKQMGRKLAREKRTKLVVVATCDPYDFLVEDGVAKEDKVETYITVYEPTKEAFDGAVRLLFGEGGVGGKVPVKGKASN